MAAYGNDDDWNNDIPDGSGESDREPLTGPTPTNLTSHRRASARWLSNHSGEVAIVCGTLSYAFHGISTEELQKKGSFPSLQVIAVRSTIGSMLTFIAIVIVHGRPESLHSIKHAITGPCDRSRRLLLTTRALLGAIASYTNYEAIKRLPLGASNALFYCYPICVTLLSWPILRERIGWLESISVLVGIGGTLLIAQPPTLFGRDDDTGDDGPSTTERAIGVAMQLLTATTFASAVVLVRYLRESTGVLTLSLWYHVASTTLALLLLLCGIQNPLPPNSPTVTGFSFLLGITSFLGAQAQRTSTYHLLFFFSVLKELISIYTCRPSLHINRSAHAFTTVSCVLALVMR